MIEFWVPGIPQPGGSKRAFPIKRKDGSVGVAVSDDNPKVKGWREVVVAYATEACTSPLEGPVRLEIEFFLPRPQGHFSKKGLRASAPLFPAVRPDTTKLVRALEDALAGLAWRNDAQVVIQNASKLYCAEGAQPGARVRIAAL